MITLNTDIFDVAELAVSAAFDGKAVCIAMYYEHACELIQEILTYSSTRISSIELNPEEWDNYSDEFIITLVKEEDEIHLYCEPAKIRGRDGYLKYEADLVFLESDAHYSIAGANEIEDAEVYEVNLDGEYDEDGECDDDEEEEDDEEEYGEYECKGDVHVSVTSPEKETVSVNMPLEKFLELLLLSDLFI